MDERPPFDTVRASFFLVAGVIALYGIVVLLGVTMCVLWGAEIMEGRAKCDSANRLSDLLGAALAAALAFAGGLNRPPPGGTKPPPGN